MITITSHINSRWIDIHISINKSIQYTCIAMSYRYYYWFQNMFSQNKLLEGIAFIHHSKAYSLYIIPKNKSSNQCKSTYLKNRKAVPLIYLINRRNTRQLSFFKALSFRTYYIVYDIQYVHLNKKSMDQNSKTKITTEGPIYFNRITFE